MSKKSKKNIVPSLPSKSIVKNLSDTLDKNNMDHTSFLCFTPEDFQNLSLKTSEDTLYPILCKLACDYKYLLISSFLKFWSTLSFNVYFQKSLDSFFRYAFRRRCSKYTLEPKNLLRKDSSCIIKDNELIDKMREIYRLVFSLIKRMTSPMIENSVKNIEFECFKILFDNWLMDVPKMLDFIAIYSSEDSNCPVIINQIANVFAQNKDYFEDFDCSFNLTIKMFEKDVFELNEIKKRDKLISYDFLNEKELEYRFTLILRILDLSFIFIDLLRFFPLKCKEKVLYNEKTSFLIENLFYEINMSKNSWKLDENFENFNSIFLQILSNCVNFFCLYFEFYSKHIVGTILALRFEKTLSNFGKMHFVPKKDNENLLLIRQLLFKKANYNGAIENLAKNGLLSAEYQEKIIIFQTTVESLELSMKNEPEPEIELQESPKNNESISPELKSDDFFLEKSNEIIQNTDEKRAKIKYEEVIISKKEKDFSLEDKERLEMAAFIKQRMEAANYEDEYDDTLDVYQDAREIVDKNILDPDSSDNFAGDVYDDDQNDDYHPKKNNYSNKTEEIPKKKEYYNKNNDFYPNNKNNDFYSNNKNKDFYPNNNDFYPNKEDYPPNEKEEYNKNYKHGKKLGQEKIIYVPKEQVISEKQPSEQQNEQKPSSYPKKNYNQDKYYKNKATYKRKY